MSVKIIIVGDCCIHGRCEALNATQLSSLFCGIKPIIQSVDAALVNLETTVITSDLKPIKKAGPALKTDARVLEMIREIGFFGVTLANNHFADYGKRGVEESLLLLDEYKLWHVGAGMNAEKAAEIGYLQVGDKRIAIINACEHEFTIAADNQAGCNALNPIHQYRAIQEAKQKADFVMVIIHGGVEHYQLPTPRMQETYRFFIDAGADAVVNHHQHCYSGYEIYQGKPIVYGLGNFFFDKPGMDSNWNKGYMVKLTFGQEMGLELIPYFQNADALGIQLMEGIDKEQFYSKIEELNTIIVNPSRLHTSLASWVETKREDYLQFLLPKIGKDIKRMARLRLIPDSQRESWTPEYMTEQRKLLLRSLFQCESHQDVLNTILQ